MKALKFLAKALIAVLGICVIVGALNYSGFSFGDLKWLSKDELLDNFIQDQFNDYIYDCYLSKFSRIDDCKKDIFYELDSNLTEIDILNKIEKIVQNDNNQTKINKIIALNFIFINWELNYFSVGTIFGYSVKSIV
ncbi:MAG: hypothetical protein KH703_03780 [Campylobacter gracilis]|uniref:hypothetical protein n=1 Tax=Campylobacter gracilis TaxID=824 RepID=UPI0026ED230E|nr:hypothetical protein [Campylobacter gracilis]MBS6152524.1 hypothetical protein [Campylobacter gracilis]